MIGHFWLPFAECYSDRKTPSGNHIKFAKIWQFLAANLIQGIN
jgi:hypothetical protein